MTSKRRRIWEKSGGKCWYCGENLPEKGWHADHFEPIRRNFRYVNFVVKYEGSIHPERDTEDNKVPCCASCNIQKGSLTVEQFREKIAGFINSLNLYHTQYAVAKRYGLVDERQVPIVFWFERQPIDDERPKASDPTE